MVRTSLCNFCSCTTQQKTHLFTEICKLLGIEKMNTTAYHPQMDGLVKCFNRTLTDKLARKLNRVEKIGMLTSLLCFLLIMLVYRRNYLFIHYNDVILGCQQPMDWTVCTQQHTIDLKGEVPFKFSEAGNWQGNCCCTCVLIAIQSNTISEIL